MSFTNGCGGRPSGSHPWLAIDTQTGRLQIPCTFIGKNKMNPCADLEKMLNTLAHQLGAPKVELTAGGRQIETEIDFQHAQKIGAVFQASVRR